VVFFLVLAGVVLLWQMTSYSSSKRAASGGATAPIKVATGINPVSPTTAVSVPTTDFSSTPLPTPGIPSPPGFIEVANNAVPGGEAAVTPPANTPPAPAEIPSLPESEMPQVLELPDSVLRASAPNPLPTGAGRVLSGPLAVVTPHTTLPGAAARVESRRNLVTARKLVATGNLQEASWAYEASLAAQPDSPKPREELATVYFRLQEPKKAADNYIDAYNLYSQQLQSGVKGEDAEAAQHGLATCRAALRALGFQIP
jgi:hypothetical protein